MSATQTTVPMMNGNGQRKSLLHAMADKHGMEPDIFEATIRATVMPAQHSREEFAACILVAKEHNLNPVTREIYFMRAKSGAIQPIVGIDGWVKKCNEHPAFDGMEFEDTQNDKGDLTAIKCTIHRNDRKHPISVTEYMAECRRQSEAWKLTPSRMLRHRALIQCARYAFGFAGVMDIDEFERWHDGERKAAAPETPSKPVLESPPDIPDEAAELLADPAGFLSALDDRLGEAQDVETLDEVWQADLDTVESRLSRSDREIANGHYAKHQDRLALKATVEGET